MTQAQEVHTIHVDLAQVVIPELATLLMKIAAVSAKLSPPSKGKFNPPPDLVKVVKMEISMSVLELEVGQKAVHAMTFDEPSPPADGAVASDNPAVATISLDPTDHLTWTCTAVSVGTANISYTGTSASPDVGAAVVPNMVVTVVAVPVAEHGDFNPAGAVITGP